MGRLLPVVTMESSHVRAVGKRRNHPSARSGEQVAKALVDAHRRSVKIQVILNKSNQTYEYSAATFTGTW